MLAAEVKHGEGQSAHRGRAAGVGLRHGLVPATAQSGLVEKSLILKLSLCNSRSWDHDALLALVGQHEEHFPPIDP